MQQHHELAYCIGPGQPQSVSVGQALIVSCSSLHIGWGLPLP